MIMTIGIIAFLIFYLFMMVFTGTILAKYFLDINHEGEASIIGLASLLFPITWICIGAYYVGNLF